MVTKNNYTPNLGDAPMFLGLPFAESHFGGIESYLRKYDDDDLRVIVEHILGCEPQINDFLESLGLPPNDGPSWWITEVLPAIRKEVERRHRPKLPTRKGGYIAQLKAMDLVEVAGHYTLLRRAGPGKWKGACPLHQERTPSFYVYESTQRWHCFGACARGGDIVDLAKALKERA